MNNRNNSNFLNGEQRHKLFVNFIKKIEIDDYDVSRNKHICEALKDVDNVYDIQFLKEALAKLMKVTVEDICGKDSPFETKFLNFIRELNPGAVPFLQEKIVLQNPDFSLYTNKVDFFLRDFNKSQIFSIARVIEEFFPGSNTQLSSHISDSKLFWMALDKTVFLQQIIPVLFGVLEKPEKISNPKNPTFKPVLNGQAFITQTSADTIKPNFLC